MELRSVHTTFHHVGEEKQQMLGLNSRLESYLSRVKLLEEENTLLVKELEALRHSGHSAMAQRKAMEEELRQARLEVAAAWRDRTHTELEVCRLSEELHALNLQRQMEDEEQVKARVAVEQSRKALEDEQRAQMWLRQKVSQLEEEMINLVQTHQENLAHQEETFSQSRVTLPVMLAQRANQGTSVLQLGQEYQQRVGRAWQETTEAYQVQLARLEGTLDQTRNRLAQVGQEMSKSQLRLKALEKEMASAQDVRAHLEKTVVERRMEYDQEVQQLQEHLAFLEEEKADLAQQMDLLVQENHGLLQAKMSLGLEVATYRALLDGENLRNVSSSSSSSSFSSSLNQPSKISGAVFGVQEVQRNYWSQLSPNPKTTSISTASTVIPSLRGQTASATIAATSPVWSRKTADESSKIPTTHSGNDSMDSKILHHEAFDHFRPQEAQEEVVCAEPPSSHPEQEIPAEGEESTGDLEPPEAMEQVQFSLSSEPLVHDDVIQHQQVTPNLTPYHLRIKEDSHCSSDESDNDFPSDKPVSVTTKHEEEKKQSGLHDPPVKKEEEETSDSETEAVIELQSESRTSSPVSEYEQEEKSSALNMSMESNREESKMTDDGVIEVETITHEADAEERLYPDGEEIDTWDSVMEKRVDQKNGDGGLKQSEDTHEHAEPEEDISSRLQEVKEMDWRQDVDVEELQVEAHPVVDLAEKKPPPALPQHEEDEDEDSQNVSMSWRTEVEGISDAQENTLADTRPLIRYKSDEADANTQVSHADDSESNSEAEQEKNQAEELRTWAEGKTQRSGTMEDLCEEVEEEEVLDEQSQLRYTHLEDSDTVLAKTEHVLGIRCEEVIHQDREKHEGSEEPAQSVVSPEPDVKLETDSLVEQKLENLDMFSYSVSFTQQQLSPSNDTAETAEEDVVAGPEPEDRINQHLRFSTSIADHPYDNPSFSNMPKATPEGRETLQNREWEEKHSMVAHADDTKDAFISSSDLEELLVQHIQGVAVLSEAGDLVLETSNESLECFKEDMTGKPNQDIQLDETQDEKAPEPAIDSPQREEDQPFGKLLDRDPSDIFEVRDLPEVLKTNGKHHNLDSLFSTSLTKDFWTSSMETGATYQPNDPFDEEAKPGGPNLVTWSSNTMGTCQEEGQEVQTGAKPVPCRSTAQAEFVHSEDSDVEAESWSSGEEPI